MPDHAISWFEIPANDIQRAAAFYSAILKADIKAMEHMGMKTAFFPVDHESGAVGGCLMEAEGYVPSEEGTVVYLNGGDDLQTTLSRVEGAGGKVLVPKRAIGENGFLAFFSDSEGNRIGLHSRK